MSYVHPCKISDVLVARISEEQCSEPAAVRATLAWLASNPIEPTEEQIKSAWSSVWVPDKNEKQNMFIALQRIAYLKKEDPLPQELKDIYAEHGFCSADVMSALQKAYKLGKGEYK